MALRLYEHPLSPYARKVKIVLYEKGLDFERSFVAPGVAGEESAARAWAASSPRLEVPTLADGRVTVFDSSVILEYVEERYPDPPTLPTDPAERARVRMLEEICDGEFEAINWGLMEIHFFKRAEGATAAEMTSRAAGQLRGMWSRLERELEGREWITGDRFGRGDAAAYPHVSGSAFFGLPVSDDFPRLQAWAARAAERPSVQQDASDVRAWMDANMSGGSTSALPRVRQYRDYRLEWMMKSGGVDIVLDGLRAGTIKFSHELQ
jgi:glutathione S-transferase/RNA polymerase-associated protein